MTDLPPPTGYSTSQLIFEDQFTSASLDTTKWNPWMGDETYDRWGNLGTLPWPYSGMNYSTSAFQVMYNDPYPYGYQINTTGAHLTGGNGNLALEAKPSDQFSSLGYSWASSAVTTYDKAYLPATGGYVQWSAKMPDSRYGAWAGLWLLSPNGAEMDIQESGYFSGTTDVNSVLASNWHGSNGSQIVQDTGVDLSAGYHTYGVEYRPGESWRVFLDGQLMGTWTSNVPTNAQYQILMDLEIAGQNAAGWHTVADPVNHPGPFEFDINDVQIYSLPPTTEPPTDAPLSIYLVNDTGTSATDHITSNAALRGTGQANTLVTIMEGSTTLGTTTGDATGAWSFVPIGLADGTHTLTVTQTDLAGNTVTATLSFTLDKTPPAVSIGLVSDTGSSATDKITSNPAIKGTGQASTAVTIKEGSTTLGTTTADATGAWSFTPPAFSMVCRRCPPSRPTWPATPARRR